MTDTDLAAIRERADETPPCVHSADTLSLLAEVERLKAELEEAHGDMRSMQDEASRHG